MRDPVASSDRTVPVRAAPVLRTVTAAAGLAATVWLLVHALSQVRAGPMPPWTLARASGIAAFGLLTLLVCLGLMLAHPTLRRRRPHTLVSRIALHTTLAVFTLTFLALHVAALISDPWAHVGWAGALLPMASRYRPIPVSLGVVAAWSGLVTGLTAALAGRWLGAAWWQVHRVALLAFLLAWAHGLWSGSDSAALIGVYVACGTVVLALALARYRAETAADLRHEQACVHPRTLRRRVP